jgi:hypothetical protein
MKKRSSLLLVLVLLAACGATARQKAITVGYDALKVSQTAFVEWDKYHQTQIVNDAKTLEDGKKALIDYRAKREKVVLSFSVAWSALAAASLYDEKGWLEAAMEAASNVYNLIKELEHG